MKCLYGWCEISSRGLYVANDVRLLMIRRVYRGGDGGGGGFESNVCCYYCFIGILKSHKSI